MKWCDLFYLKKCWQIAVVISRGYKGITVCLVTVIPKMAKKKVNGSRGHEWFERTPFRACKRVVSVFVLSAVFQQVASCHLFLFFFFFFGHSTAWTT